MLYRCGLFPFGCSGTVQLYTNSRVECLSRPYRVDLTTKGLEPYHDLLHLFADASFLLTSPPLVPYLMCAPVLGQVGVLRVPR